MHIHQLPLIRSFFHKQAPKPEPLSVIEILNTITRIALGAIAVMRAPLLFAPFFTAGVAWGIYHNQTYGCPHHHPHHPTGCGQGFMESMAGVKFPPALSLLTNLAVTICHVDHHPGVYVPYSALALGMWTGQLINKQLPTISLYRT